MNSSWSNISLNDILYIKGRIGWKGLNRGEYLKEGYLIFNGDNIKNNKLNLKKIGRISKERFDESPEIILKENDILMTKDGTIGKIAYISKLSEPTTIASGLFLIRKKSEKILQKYLWYIFLSKNFKNLIKEKIEGSVIPHLYQRDFESFRINLPDINEQKKITEILELIDKKIELNQIQNSKLEQMATDIFKYLFINFDTIKSNDEQNLKIGVNQSKECPHISFDKPPLGEIPKGWKIKELSSIINFQNGNAFKSNDWIEKGIPVVKIANVKPLILDIDKCSFISEDVAKENKKFLLNRGDILIGMTGYVGEVCLVKK